MNCTNKQQETAECEKRGCEGCFYNQEVDDLTTVYLSGFYDGEKKWKDKIKAKIEKLKVLAEKADDETLNACELDIRKNQIYLLDNLLNGETTIKI